MTFGGVGNAIFYSKASTNVLCDMVPLKNACAKVNITELIFCPLTYNGEVAKIDLRSPISKIQDIRFVGTDDLIIFRKFHNFP